MEEAEHERLGRMGSRASWALLVWLILAVPLIYLPRVFSGAVPVPQPTEPAWVHLLVITVGEWPAEALAEARLEHPALREQVRRSTGIPLGFSPSTSSAASAASLWTGRWPANCGVVAQDRALPLGTWTLAEAARRSGTATAAFLEEPFVSATGIGGFQTVASAPDLGPAGLAERAARFVAEHPDERVLVWLHLREAGPGAVRLGELVELLAEGPLAGSRRFDTLTLMTGLRGSAPLADDDDRAHRVPLWVELPTSLLSGRRSPGAASLTDLVSALLIVTRLAQPDEGAGEVPLQARPYMEMALKGAGGYEWLMLHSPQGHAIRFGKTRFAAEGPAPAGEELLRLQLVEPQTRQVDFAPQPPGRRRQLLAQYGDICQQVLRGATAAVPAETPPIFRELPGW